MTTWTSGGSPSCAEEAGTMTESFDDEKGLMKASVTLRCAYADRHNLVANIVGGRRAWPKGAPGQVPKAFSAAIVPVVSLGVDTGDEVINYLEALVTINYDTKLVDLYSEEIEPTSEFLTLDHRWFRWEPYTGQFGIDIPGTGSGTGGGAAVVTITTYDPLREEEAPGIQQRGINFVRTDYNQTTIPDPVTDWVGMTNADTVTFSLLGKVAIPETLVYLPPSISTKVDSSNTRKFDVVKRFNYNPQGFNQFFRAATGRYHRIVWASNLTENFIPYPLVTFAGNLL